MKHQHPIKILKLTVKNFWLLIIPLVRGLINLKFDFKHWIEGAYLDIIVLILILLFAFVRWWFQWYEIKENSIRYKGGIFAHYEYEIPFSVISAVTAQFSFFYRPIKAVNVFIETDSVFGGKNEKSADMKMILTKKETEQLLLKLPSEKEIDPYSFSPRKSHLIIFSFLFSSTLSGVIFISTFLIQNGRIFDRSVEQELIKVVSDITKKIAVAVPPAAMGISIFLIAGWLFSFISNLLRLIGFGISRSGRDITIRNGFFTKLVYYINSDKVNFADFRQNLLMKLFKIKSVQVSCSGYGKRKQEIPVFVPITTESEASKSLKKLLPRFEAAENELESPIVSLFIYLRGGIFALLGTILFNAASLIFFTEFWEFVQFAVIMLMIPSAWLLIVECVSFLTSGVGSDGGCLTLRYSTFLKFHTVVIPEERIAKFEIRQTIFQVYNGTCDLIVRTYSESSGVHRVRYLPYDETKKFLAEHTDLYGDISAKEDM